MKNRLILFQMQEPADLCRSRNSFDPLFSSFDLNMVIISQYLEKRSVFKLPGCDPGKVNISNITDIVKMGTSSRNLTLSIYIQPDSFSSSVRGNIKSSGHCISTGLTIILVLRLRSPTADVVPETERIPISLGR